DTVAVHPSERGQIKQVLLKLGWPAEDLAGYVVRDTVLRPAAEAARAVGRTTRQALASARASVRQARADVRRMLFGEPRQREAVARREPAAAGTRTLGSSTTALTKD
ncbi:hypothetical protein ACWDPP_39690, partial [Streptomyces sp. NPDC000851]